MDLVILTGAVAIQDQSMDVAAKCEDHCWGSVSGTARSRDFCLCLIVRFLSVLCNELLTNAGADGCKLSDWWRLITDLEPL